MGATWRDDFVMGLLVLVLGEVSPLFVGDGLFVMRVAGLGFVVLAVATILHEWGQWGYERWSARGATVDT